MGICEFHKRSHELSRREEGYALVDIGLGGEREGSKTFQKTMRYF